LSRVQLPERRLRLAYFGTPDIAASVLAALLDADRDDVVLVACQPDRPKGRGRKLAPPPVKTLALERGIEVIQPTKMKDGTLAAKLAELELDLVIVAAFGRIITQDTLDTPAHGFWNVHASLLPQHRGASPIQHSILHGDTTSGITLMQMTAGLDEGPMLKVAALELDPRETASSLHDKLAELGGRTLVDGLAAAKSAGLEVTPQDDAGATYAPLLKKSDGQLDLTEPAEVLDRRIRALNPWPGTFLPSSSGPLRITAATPIDGDAGPVAGLVVERGERLVLGTGAGLLQIVALQPPGKKPMSAADFLNGSGRNTAVGKPLVN